MKKIIFSLISLFVIFGLANVVSAATIDVPVDQATISEAILVANVGDIILLSGDVVTSEQVTINKAITLDGGGHTIDAAFAKTSNSNNSAIGVQSDNVSVKDIHVTSSADQPWPGQLHGINVYESTGVILEDVIVSDFEGSGIVVNSSEVTASNITTSNNGWHAINVDQKTSSAAVLIISNTSVHDETLIPHIFVDDISKDVTVNDPDSQYSFVEFEYEGSTARAYTLLDVIAPEVPTATLAAGGVNVPDNGYTSSKTFTFNLSSSGDTIRYQLKYWNDIPGDSFYGENHAWNPTDLSGYSSSLGVYNDQFTRGEGVHYFAFSACDVAGNCSEYSAPFVVTYDITAPVVEITNPTNESIVSGVVDIKASIDDANPHHYYLVIKDAEGDVVGGPRTVPETSLLSNVSLYSWDTTIFSDGEYTVFLAARDAAGNRGPASEDAVKVIVNNIPDTKNECKKGGWELWPVLDFKNQGQCVSYIEANEKAGKK